MQKLQIQKKIGTPGEVQDYLRSIVSAINNGEKSGKGWKIGEGEIEQDAVAPVAPVAPAVIEGLEPLALELRNLVLDEDLTDEKLRDASENLLPTLSDTLAEAGYGRGDEQDEGTDDNKPKPEESSVEGEKDAPGASQGQKKGKFPWDKKS